VSAQDFEFTAEEVDIDILPGQTASYLVTIYNYQDTADRFQLTGGVSATILWDISTDTPIIEVPAGDSTQSFLYLTPHIDVGLGPKQIIMKLKSLNTGEIFNKAINVYIGEGARFGTYVPNVAVTVDIDKEIDPRQPVDVYLCLKNKNLLDIEKLQIFIDGEIFEKSYETPLGPLESKCQEILFTLEETQVPGQHILTVTAIRNETLATIVKNYEVVGYSTVTETFQTEKGFFMSTETIQLFNDGNQEDVKVVRRETSAFSRMFVRSNPDYEVMSEDGVSYVGWSISLEAGESATITLVKDYRWPFIVIIIILVAIVLYFVLRSPIILFKDAYVVGKEGEGVSDLKIKVLVKNRTRRSIKNLRIIDKVPSIAEVIEKEHLGTIKPSKIIKHGKKGTILKWDIEGFEPYEERILSYKIKSSLKIVGGISLPSVKARFDTRQGRERTTTSNPVGIHRKD
ncbi:MAG: hypothetical protein ABIE94_01525, partial [archaeon]